jgi:hypothetical protein
MSSLELIQQKIDRENFVFTTRSRAKIREVDLTIQTKNARARGYDLKQLCNTLHRLAQKYVPNNASTFKDFADLVEITRALQQLDVKLDVAANVCAPVSAVDNATVINSHEYRYMRNKAIAALATIADLTTKASPPGAVEYQRGVREGYRRASEVAVLFLEDIQNGVA